MSEHGNNLIVGDNDQSNVDERLFEAYNAVCDAEEKLAFIESSVEDSIPEKIDPCLIGEIIQRLNDIIKTINDVQYAMFVSLSNALSSGISKIKDSVTQNLSNEANKISEGAAEIEDQIADAIDSSINNLYVDIEYTKYYATQIILKKYQIIKYRIDYIKTGIEVMNATLEKKIYMDILNGKGSALDPNINEQVSAISKAASVVNQISSSLNAILSAINSMTALNVNGAGMAFFPTPKSVSKVDINIANMNQSTTNFIPDDININIENIIQSYRKNRGIEKKAKIAEMTARSAESVSNGGEFNPGKLGKLTAFNSNTIKTAANAIIQALTCAEAVPRYEKLNISNIRFLTFLLTGFEPAGKKCFGIPGMP